MLALRRWCHEDGPGELKVTPFLAGLLDLYRFGACCAASQNVEDNISSGLICREPSDTMLYSYLVRGTWVLVVVVVEVVGAARVVGATRVIGTARVKVRVDRFGGCRENARVSMQTTASAKMGNNLCIK